MTNITLLAQHNEGDFLLPQIVNLSTGCKIQQNKPPFFPTQTSLIVAVFYLFIFFIYYVLGPEGN